MTIDLLAIGGAHIDRVATLLEPHIGGASNPASFSQTIGGGALNALRVAKLRGIQNTAIMSVRGGDAASADVEQELVRQDIEDFSGMFMDRATPSYTAIIDVDGALVTALADMELYDFGFERQVRRAEGRARIAQANAVLVDANLPSAAIENVCAHATGKLFGMCISPAKAGRLASSAAHFDLVFMNQAELASLTARKKDLATLGFKRVVITDGSAPIALYENEQITELKVPSATWISDVTGAGDALTGGTIAAMLAAPEKPLRTCVFEGMACASLALQAHGPLCEAIDTQEFDRALATIRAAQ